MILSFYVGNIVTIQTYYREMSDDGDWGVDVEQVQREETQSEATTEQTETKSEVKTEGQPVASSGRGRQDRGRNMKTEEQPKKESGSDSDQWIADTKDADKSTSKVEEQVPPKQKSLEKPVPIETTVRNASVQKSMSAILNPDATELEAGGDTNNSWIVEDTNKEATEVKEVQPARQRGNRGQTNTPTTEEDEGGRRRGNREDVGGRGNREDGGGYRGNRDGGNRDYNQGGGYRGNREGGGGGGGGGGYRGNREEGAGGGGYRGNREDGGGFNRNRQQGGGGAGYRGNRDSGGFNRGNREGGERGNINQNNNGNNDQNNQKSNSEVQGQKLVTTTARRAWPACQLFVVGKRFSITLRRVQDFNSKLLIVPYRNLRFDYYPGNYILSRPFAYKEKLQAKSEQCGKAGNVYLQRAIEMGTYAAVAFLKVDDAKVEESLNDGIQQVMKGVSKLPKQAKVDSIVFPMCSELCEPELLIRLFVKHLENSQLIKEIALTTKDPKHFDDALQAYRKYIMESVEENEICLQ